MMVKMLQKLENRMEKMQEAFNTVNAITKDIEEINNIQTEMNNTIIEIENTLEGTNSSIPEVEDWISELEDRMVEITAEEQNKGKRMKRIDDSLRDLWYNIKCTDIHVIGVPEEEEEKKGAEKIFEEITVENFPNMGKEIVNQVQEVLRIPYRLNPRRNISRHILIKLTDTKKDTKLSTKKEYYKQQGKNNK